MSPPAFPRLDSSFSFRAFLESSAYKSPAVLVEVISASPRQGLCIVGGKREPELWKLCDEFIQNPWGDSVSLLYHACLGDHRYLFLLVYLEESILRARTSAFFVALGSSLSL